MEDTTIINVIIPVFNSEKTIARTLSSLVAQSCKKFIVTVIDDCSTDNTLEIIKKFIPTLPIRIIKLEKNEGVGHARQVGIDNNECDFICFLDSDDMFMPQTINIYRREMTSGFPEVLYTDFISEQKGKEVLLVGKTSITWFHGKCYRKDFIEKYEIKMPPVRYNEDSGFSTIVNELAEKKAYVPEITYFWSENPNSLTRSDEDFRIKSTSNFTNSIKYALLHINKYKEVQNLPVFYGQLNNLYHYYMESLYREYEYTPALKEALINYFKELWIESRIRAHLVVAAFTHLSPLNGQQYMVSLSPVQWINEMAGTEYTPQDFREDNQGDKKE